MFFTFTRFFWRNIEIPKVLVSSFDYVLALGVTNSPRTILNSSHILQISLSTRLIKIRRSKCNTSIDNHKVNILIDKIKRQNITLLYCTLQFTLPDVRLIFYKTPEHCIERPFLLHCS